MRRTTTVMCAAVIVLALAAACAEGPGGGQQDTASTRTATSGPGDDSLGTPGPAPSPVEVRMRPGATGPAPPIEGSRSGGTLRLATSGSPLTLDPSAQYVHDVTGLLRLTHRTLTTYAVRDGATVLVPDLATDLGTASEDGLSWTFTLKKGLQYEDGSPVRAADVAYAIKRSFATEELPGGPSYQFEYLLGGDTYQGPYRGGDDFAGVEAPDDRTVVIHLSQPWPSLPYYAAFTQTSPIPEEADTGRQYGQRPIATGPYRFAEYTRGEELVLVPNEHWDPASDAARYQFPDRIEVTFGQDRLEVAEAVMGSEGEAARTLSYDGVPAQIHDEATGAHADQLVTGPSPCVSYVTLDVRKIPLEVRRAVAAAWPYDQIRRAGGITDMDAVPATTIGPAVMAGFEPFVLPRLTGTGTGEPDRARDMLAEAGAEGFELSWYYAIDDEQRTRMNQVRKDHLEQAGFKVKDIGVPGQEIREVRADPDATVNMLQGPPGWCFDWPAGDGFYPSILRSSVIDSGHSAGFLAEPEVDREIDRISALPVAEQASQWAELDEMVLSEHLPLIPVSYDQSAYIFGDQVRGVVNDPNLGMPHLSAIWLQPGR